MRKSRHTAESVASGPRQARRQTQVLQDSCEMDISEQTLYRWRKEYGGTGFGEVGRLMVLEDGKKKLRRLLAGLPLGAVLAGQVVRRKGAGNEPK